MNYKLKHKAFLLTLLLMVFCGAIFAQNTGDISGTVMNSKNEPVIGATVQVKGTNRMTVTNTEGNFSINARAGETVVISSAGYITQEVGAAALRSQSLVILTESVVNLDDVVVIGYGTVKRKELSSAVNVVSARSAGATTATNPSQLLIGKAPGVQVVQSNGRPGSDAQIIIRGTGSFTNIDPLYIIDGIQGNKGMFNGIANQDIEDITILKDASTTAIYGSSGANGVVIVTTRKGKSGAPRVNVTSQWGISNPWKQLKVLNAAQYVDLLKDFAATSNTVLPAKFNTQNVLVDSNNWQSQIFRQALESENTVNVSGGGEKVTYNFSAGYIAQQAIIKDYQNNKFNSRLSLTETLGRFKFGQSIALRYSRSRGQMANVIDAIGYAPYKPVFDKNILGGYSIVSNVEDFSNVNNPLMGIGVQRPRAVDLALYPQLYAEVSLLQGLKFRSQFAAEIGGGRSNSYQYEYMASNYLTYARQAGQGYYDYSNYITENYFNYDRSFGNHNVGAIVGMSYQDAGKYAGLAATGSSIPNDNLQNISIAPKQSVSGSNYNYARPSVISYYGRVNYSFAGKYILNASLRRDGASNFGENFRFGTFSGVGFAWRFIDESFFENTVLSEGKLRLAWGRNGNNSIPNFLTSPLTYGGSPTGNLVYSFGTDEAFYPGITVNSLSNINLRWEQTDQTNIGTDLGFLNNKITFSADYYNRKSNGLLVSVPIPASSGIGTTGAQPQKTVNAASVYNRGLEFVLGYRDEVSERVNYNISANFSLNKNEVISLGDQFTAPIQAGSFNQLSTFTITKPGSPIGSFYGYRMDHVAKNAAEIDALNAAAKQKTGKNDAVYQSGLKPGDFIFRDINGDGIVNDKDQEILGAPIPKYLYGLNAGANFYNFDLNVVVSGVSGVQLLNATKFYTQMVATGHNATTGILDRWRKDGDVALLPRAGQNANASGNLRASDWWIENGAYTRLRNITLGYSLPHSVINGVANHTFKSVRIYLAAQNLITLTKYTGYDPEVSVQTYGNYTFSRGIDDGQIPQPRTFIVGLQLGF